ncbi:MAG: tRNA (adenosine(37)-N6)-threonylcarbamoyltransferase complex transferase subunit TsaD [Candidatus Dormibacteraeota bacterium]|nr:tRNA (adenosine(37)-N6)-threonylcarbamoyltransferase complex transferase subunit TsaD [Candidatus Dormibacteraeota bacterium]
MLALALESSCDESSVALVDDRRRVLGALVHSQLEHSRYGGIVPELAARDHLEKLPQLVATVLSETGRPGSDVDLVAVTRGPGLAGCLLVGAGLAEGLAAAWERPLVGVNHLWGHVYAALLARPELEPPLLALVVSGAHTDLVRMPAHGIFEVLGRTRDDAAGEAFDKAARMLGLGYPGGPALDRAARLGDWTRQPLPVPSLRGLEFSFSGLKTALLYRLRDLGGPDTAGSETVQDLAAAFERSVVEALVGKLAAALRVHPHRQVVVAGGVAANTLLRRRAGEVVAGRARLTIPPLDLCTDNAAMIGVAAFHVPRGSTGTVDPGLGWAP